MAERGLHIAKSRLERNPVLRSKTSLFRRRRPNSHKALVGQLIRALCCLVDREQAGTQGGSVPSVDATGADESVGQAARLRRYSAGEPTLARRTATYAALDLGTNNCRLLVARPLRDPDQRGRREFSHRRRLFAHRAARRGLEPDAAGSPKPAIRRTIDALLVCRDKMMCARRHACAPDRHRGLPRGRERRRIHRAGAREHGPGARSHQPRDRGAACGRGLRLAGRFRAKSVVLFDIGGGSSEIVWLGGGTWRARRASASGIGLRSSSASSRSAERFGGAEVTYAQFSAMTDLVVSELQQFLATRLEGGEVPAFPSARHFGHGDDAGGRPSQSAAL